MHIKERIEKLLRLAESSNPHEAEQATRRAEALMLKWGIEDAELDANRGQTEEIVEVTRDYTDTYPIVWPTFVNSVCMGLGRLRCLRMNLPRGHYRVYIIGHESDVERCEMLLNSLEFQARVAEGRWWNTYDGKAMYPKNQRYKLRRQFLISFGQEVGDRLRTERLEQEQAAAGNVPGSLSKGTDIVLADRDKAVAAWMHQQHSVKRSQNRMHGAHGGREAGREAGRNATLGQEGVGASGRQALS